MPGDITIKDYQIREAERFLEALLATNIPEGNFKPGSHLHDIVIRAFAYVVAYIRAEVDEVSSLQSLQQLRDLSGYSVDAAVDNLVSNWFITRRDGTKSRGVIRLYFDPEVEVAVIPAATVFTYSEGQEFVPVSDTDIVLYKGGNLSEKYSEGGLLTGYCADIAVEAQFSGVGAAVAPGVWQSWDDVSEHLYMVESQFNFTSSQAIESSEELIERARESVTSRDFLSRRSLNAAILEDMPTVSSVYAVGAGDPEMMRDRVLGFGDSETVHALGHVNVYARGEVLPGQTYAQVLPTGESIVSLPEGTRIARFVQVSVYRLTDLLEETNYEAALPTRISHRFDSSTGTYTYYSGDTHLSRDSFGIAISDTSGRVTSRSTTTLSTEVFSVPTYDGFSVNNNGTYTVSVGNTDFFNTKRSAVSIDVGVATHPRRVVVSYDTYVSPNLLDTYLEDRDRRVLASNMLAYSPVPLVVRLGITYLRATSDTSLVPQDLIKTSISDFVETYVLEQPLKASAIVTFIMNSFPGYVSSVSFPVGMSYTLESPDGRLVEFYSEDSIDLVQSNVVSQDLSTGQGRLDLQVSNQTVQLICRPSDVTLTEVSR